MCLSPCIMMTSTQLGEGGRCCSGAGWDMTGGGLGHDWRFFLLIFYFFLIFFFLVLSLPWDWSSTNFGEILHIGCSSIAAWIYIFGGARPGFEPGTALQQSGVLTSRPRLTPHVNINMNIFMYIYCTCILYVKYAHAYLDVHEHTYDHKNIRSM